MSVHYSVFQVLFLAVLASGCSASKKPAVAVAERTVYLSGRIDQSMAEQFSKIDLASQNEIVVESRGGDVGAAFRIAEKISASGKTLRIKGECMSACASILLPSALRRRVEPGALIALHGTQTGLFKLFQRTREMDRHDIPQSPAVAARANQELSLYRKAGVDPRFLLLSYVTRGELCYANAKQPDGSQQFAIGTERPASIVSPEALAAFGLSSLPEKLNGLGPATARRRAVPSPAKVAEMFDALIVKPCV